jgi:hypothetical protein
VALSVKTFSITDLNGHLVKLTVSIMMQSIRIKCHYIVSHVFLGRMPLLWVSLFWLPLMINVTFKFNMPSVIMYIVFMPSVMAPENVLPNNFDDFIGIERSRWAIFTGNFKKQIKIVKNLHLNPLLWYDRKMSSTYNFLLFALLW